VNCPPSPPAPSTHTHTHTHTHREQHRGCFFAAATRLVSAHAQCTGLHEYLESKTTTHVFADLSSCPGTDGVPSFRGTTGEVVLSSADGVEQTRVFTPIKVNHAAGCGGATMELQLNATAGTLVVDDLTVQGTLTLEDGTDLANRLGTLQEHIEAISNASSSFRYTELPSKICTSYCEDVDTTALTDPSCIAKRGESTHSSEAEGYAAGVAACSATPCCIGFNLAPAWGPWRPAFFCHALESCSTNTGWTAYFKHNLWSSNTTSHLS